MENSITGCVSVNPEEILYNLQLADFTYPSDGVGGEADPIHGWSHFPAIPGLVQLMVKQNRFPGPNTGVKFLMDNCDPAYIYNARVLRRAHKLYLIFAREMHTWALLQHHGIFSVVQYQRVCDLQYNVDYLASILSCYLTKHSQDCQPVGIQSTIS